MRTSYVLAMSFFGAAIIILILGNFSAVIFENEMKKNIGQNNQFLAIQAMNEIDRRIYDTIIIFDDFSSHSDVKQNLLTFNQEFEMFDDVNDYINKKDDQWRSAQQSEITSFMQDIIDNDLSQNLRVLQNKHWGIENPVYPEIFITNAYGANVAQTGKTTDYRQDDEEWWQKAKQDGTYISDVSFDESSRVYSTNLSFRIDDEEGTFLGVLKVVVDISELANFLNDLKIGYHEHHQTMNVKLVDENRRIIFSTTDEPFFSTLPKEELSELVEKSGYFVIKEEAENEELHAYAVSDGYGSYFGTGWMLILEHDSHDILVTIHFYRNMIILLTVILSALSGTIGIWSYYSISKPTTRLSLATKQVANGNLDVIVEPKGTFENKTIADAFNKMVKSLKRSNEEIQKIKEALDHASLVAITDKDGTITYANEKFCEISKYSRDELIGQNHHILKSGYHPRSFYTDIWSTITKGLIWKGDIKNKAKDGSFYWVRTTIVPFFGPNGIPEQYIAIRTDITEQKKMEEKLAHLVEELKKSEQLKDEFSTMVAHELKTPLTPILGNIEFLKNPKMIDKLDSAQLEAINSTETNAKRLETLIRDLLDAQKIHLSKMKFTKSTFDVKDFMKGVKTNLSYFTNKKKITFINNTPDSFELLSDENRLRQVIGNLVKNSVDFVPESGRIEIGATVSGNNALFYVKDNGIGIPKSKQHNLFKKFYQADTSIRRKHGGTGLGLVVCKGIVEGLGGKIWFESKEGKETTFYFTIPLQGQKVQVKSP